MKYIKEDLNLFDKFFRGFVIGVLKIHCKLWYHLKVYGKENIPMEGSTIFCGNHKTLMDAVFIKQVFIIFRKNNECYFCKS